MNFGWIFGTVRAYVRERNVLSHNAWKTFSLYEAGKILPGEIIERCMCHWTACPDETLSKSWKFSRKLSNRQIPGYLRTSRRKRNHLSILNQSRFPVSVYKAFFRAASWEDFLHIASVSWIGEREGIGTLFCFHDFFPLQSVMIAFIKMKKCKIKFHWTPYDSSVLTASERQSFMQLGFMQLLDWESIRQV